MQNQKTERNEIIDDGSSMEHWIVESSEPIFTSPWISVFRETVKIPQKSITINSATTGVDGEKQTVVAYKTMNPFYYVKEPDWVSIIALTPSNQIILVQQYRRGCNRVILELPGGCIDEADLPPSSSTSSEVLLNDNNKSNNVTVMDEIAQRAGLRELEEETGYCVDYSKPIVNLGTTLPDCSRTSSTAYGFLCHVTSEQPIKKQELDENETIRVVSMSASRVYQKFCIDRQEALSPVHTMFLFRAFVHLGQLPQQITLQ